MKDNFLNTKPRVLLLPLVVREKDLSSEMLTVSLCADMLNVSSIFCFILDSSILQLIDFFLLHCLCTNVHLSTPAQFSLVVFDGSTGSKDVTIHPVLQTGLD